MKGFSLPRGQDLVMIDDGSYMTIVPLTKEELIYLLELQDTAGTARDFPQVLKESPYWIIPPSSEPGE
jgi:hypothetical protein